MMSTDEIVDTVGTGNSLYVWHAIILLLLKREWIPKHKQIPVVHTAQRHDTYSTEEKTGLGSRPRICFLRQMASWYAKKKERKEMADRLWRQTAACKRFNWSCTHSSVTGISSHVTLCNKSMICRYF